jgi:acyl-CoA reductase-like NAD-dependent aldehyde dehydrogenase
MGTSTDATFRAVDPRTGRPGEQAFQDASDRAVAAAADAARTAFRRELDGRTFDDAALLRSVADAVDADRADLRTAAGQETGLPDARLDGEIARTTGQLRAFADAVDAGQLLGVVIDHADADAHPPVPDQRRLNIPLGVIAVWGASNFPFAFSVAGGDTASAFAAGCPVIVKAHPSHPRTSELTAEAVKRGVRDAGGPDAWFHLLQGRDHRVGEWLINDPNVDAAAFTGSTSGGLALRAAAARRHRPIPVFAEMGSVNPAIILPGAAAEDPSIAEGLVGALTASNGQLCTKPGLVFMLGEPASRALADRVAEALAAQAPQPLLNETIRRGFTAARDHLAKDPDVEIIVESASASQAGTWQTPLLAQTSGHHYLHRSDHLDEIFGPAAVIVWCSDLSELKDCLDRRLQPALSASVHAQRDEDGAQEIVRHLTRLVGRIVYNGFSTGVTVGWATVHGGPYPATTDSRHTSVGMLAAQRFLRPVGFQNVPTALLPEALRDDPPRSVERRLNGRMTVS